MKKASFLESPRIEIIIAILIAAVSLTFALCAWRISLVSSSAGDANRLGTLDALKKQAAVNEDWRKTYEEANYAVGYASYLAEVEALETSGDPAAAEQAANLRSYLLPNLQLLASPLASEEQYLNADGTYDLEARFQALEDETPDLRDLDPQKSFKLAEQYFSEQRWLTVVGIILAISLFWLALAEVGGKALRLTVMVIGTIVYLIGLGGLLVIEVVSVIVRGGVL